MARLSEEHRNIVPVYDAAICADGRPYLVMQYCPQAGPGQAVQGRAVRRRRGAVDRRAARRGGGVRAPAGHPAPGHQARQRADQAVRPAGAHRLRHRGDDRRCRGPGRGGRVDPVESAGIARRRPGRRRPLRRVLAGRDALHVVGPPVPVRAPGPVERPGRPAQPDSPGCPLPQTGTGRPRARWNACLPAAWPRIRPAGIRRRPVLARELQAGGDRDSAAGHQFRISRRTNPAAVLAELGRKSRPTTPGSGRS